MKKTNPLNAFRKALCSAVALIHLTTVAFAAGDTAATLDSSQERALLTSIIALSGQKLNRTDYQKQAISLISEYAKTSNDDHRLEKLSQASVELGVMTPAQSEALRDAVASEVNQAIVAHPEMSAKEGEQITIAAVEKALSHPLAGAQFSACANVLIGLGLIIGSVFGDIYLGESSPSSMTLSLGVAGTIVGYIAGLVVIGIDTDECSS